MAENQGFEPWAPFKGAHEISSFAPSTSRTILHKYKIIYILATLVSKDSYMIATFYYAIAQRNPSLVCCIVLGQQVLQCARYD